MANGLNVTLLASSEIDRNQYNKEIIVYPVDETGEHKVVSICLM